MNWIFFKIKNVWASKETIKKMKTLDKNGKTSLQIWNYIHNM